MWNRNSSESSRIYAIIWYTFSYAYSRINLVFKSFKIMYDKFHLHENLQIIGTAILWHVFSYCSLSCQPFMSSRTINTNVLFSPPNYQLKCSLLPHIESSGVRLDRVALTYINFTACTNIREQDHIASLHFSLIPSVSTTCTRTYLLTTCIFLFIYLFIFSYALYICNASNY